MRLYSFFDNTHDFVVAQCPEDFAAPADFPLQPCGVKPFEAHPVAGLDLHLHKSTPVVVIPATTSDYTTCANGLLSEFRDDDSSRGHAGSFVESDENPAANGTQKNQRCFFRIFGARFVSLG